MSTESGEGMALAEVPSAEQGDQNALMDAAMPVAEVKKEFRIDYTYCHPTVQNRVCLPLVLKSSWRLARSCSPSWSGPMI